MREEKIYHDDGEQVYDLLIVKPVVGYLLRKSLDSQKAQQESLKTSLLELDLQRKTGAVVPVSEAADAIQKLNNKWIAAFSFLTKEELNRGIRNYANGL
jgi:hypothetical protein